MVLMEEKKLGANIPMNNEAPIHATSLGLTFIMVIIENL